MLLAEWLEAEDVQQEVGGLGALWLSMVGPLLVIIIVLSV